jgi:Cof subfamily protein (haloacid dehalogenase superfamily)
MSIKMIVTDLDGTLLRRDKTISEYTASVFDRCRNAGIKIIFATARPVRAVVKWLNMDIQSDACIYHNGAVIKIGDELFQEKGIEHDVVNKLLGEAKQLNNMRIAAEISDILYANFDASTIWLGVEYIMTDFCNLPKLPADKIIFITTDKVDINKIEQLFNENLYWEISENEVLMVMNKNARKRNAINEIANHFGISLTEIAAFGDDYNDIEMLRDCGIGVAVANAIDEAKAAADYICDTNENDGVAKWLEENVL